MFHLDIYYEIVLELYKQPTSAPVKIVTGKYFDVIK